jgi:hypothetical protein
VSVFTRPAALSGWAKPCLKIKSVSPKRQKSFAKRTDFENFAVCDFSQACLPYNPADSAYAA